MKSTIAWSLAVIASGVGLYFGTTLEIKLLAVLTPFVLWAAVLRGRIHKLEAQLDAKQGELEQAKSEIQRLLSHAAAFVDSQISGEDAVALSVSRSARSLVGTR